MLKGAPTKFHHLHRYTAVSKDILLEERHRHRLGVDAKPGDESVFHISPHCAIWKSAETPDGIPDRVKERAPIPEEEHA